ncbi:hypothetical protein [Paenibacillus medicaginis]|uniref:Uncharacterized protein n=1 Tax=Paenibacillus medicaginis TaxID=1470560 RepID=A0ABV5BUE1_9BACL
MYNEYEHEYEPSELECVIMALVDSEVEKKVTAFKQEYEWYKIQHDKYINLKKDYDDLKKKQGQTEDFLIFQSLINESNITALLSSLKLKQTDISFDGMHDECIPVWFKLVCWYYEDRERLFRLFDLFAIPYPSWARKFKLPFDYNENELDLIFEKLGRMYVCNGCLFSGNMGFFYKEISRHKGDLSDLLTKSSYSEIPWNLLLQNKLLVTDKFFNKIIDSLSKGATNSTYFFRIQDYQQISEDQVVSMFNYLPKGNFYDDHKRFIENNKKIIKMKPELADKFKEKINDNQYSAFYYLNYPLHMQIEFVKNYNDRFNTKFELVKKMSISKNEKVKLMSEITAELLDKK